MGITVLRPQFGEGRSLPSGVLSGDEIIEFHTCARQAVGVRLSTELIHGEVILSLYSRKRKVTSHENVSKITQQRLLAKGENPT